MPQINPAQNVLRGARQVVRVMYQMVQVWPPWRTFCDYFERPNGPLGPSWMPGVIRRTGGYDACTTIAPYIVSGHVEGDEDIPITTALPPTGALTTFFYDNFDRSAGPLGPTWIPSTAAMDTAVPPMPVIAFARAADPAQDTQTAYAFVDAQITGDYTVTLHINSVSGLGNTIAVLAAFDPATATGLEFGFVSESDLGDTGHLYYTAWDHGTDLVVPGLSMATPRWLRITKVAEMYTMFYALSEGTPVYVAWAGEDFPEYTARRVGMRIDWAPASTYTPYIDSLEVGIPAPPPVASYHLLNDVMTVETYIGDQFIEITTDNVHQGAAPEPTGTTWTDDLTSLDAWHLVPGQNMGTSGQPIFFELGNGGAAGRMAYACWVSGCPDIGIPSGTQVINSMTRRVASPGGTQSIEVDLHDLWQRHPSLTLSNPDCNMRVRFYLWTHFDPADSASGRWAVLSIDNWAGSVTPPLGYTASARTSNSTWVYPYGTGAPTDWPPVAGDSTLRFECFGDGREVLTLNGAVLVDVGGPLPPPEAGDFQGVDLWWDLQMGDNPAYRPPSIIQASGAGSGTLGGELVQGAFILYCQANTKNLCCTAVWCEYRIVGGDGLLWAYVFQQNALGQVVPSPPGEGSRGRGTLAGWAFPADPVAKLRWEVAQNGHVRLLATDDQFTEQVVMDRSVPALTGDRVGFAFMWRGGEQCDTWADDFERADGPLGPDWMLGLQSGTGEDLHLPTISGGAAVSPGRTTGGSPYPVGVMQWAHPQPAASQWVEITFDNWYSTNPATQSWFEVYNFGGGGVEGERRRAAGFQFAWNAGAPRVVVDVYTYCDSGNTTNGQFIAYRPWTGTTGPQTLRLESYASGRQIVSLNGVIIHDYIEVEVTDPDDPNECIFTYESYYQGVWSYWWQGTTGNTAPRILSMTGGCLEPSVSESTGPGSSYHILEVCGGLGQIPARTVGPLNLVFCVDTTGSMPDGSQLNAILHAIVVELGVQYGASNLTIGVIDYKDYQEEGGYDDGTLQPYKIYTDLTSSAATYNAAINRFDDGVVYGGGDTPEPVYSALHAAANLGGWGTGVKNILIIADAEPLNPEPHTGHTFGSTMAMLNLANIRVSSLVADYPLPVAAMGAIADATNGEVVVMDIYDEDLIDEIAQAVVEAISVLR